MTMISVEKRKNHIKKLDSKHTSFDISILKQIGSRHIQTELSGTDTSVLFRLQKTMAYAFQLLNNPEKSIGLLNMLLKEHESDPELHYYLGLSYENLKEYKKAIKSYNTAINLDKKYIEAIEGLGRLYRDNGVYDKAEELFNRANILREIKHFEENLSKEIEIQRIEIHEVLIFKKIQWDIQPQINILLGKNGYGKTLLSRILIALLQKNNEMAKMLFQNSSIDSYAKIYLLRENKEKIIHRTETVFEKSIGKIPILAIPDVRTIAKSKLVISSERSSEGDLKEIGAKSFIYETGFEEHIQRFLTKICISYLDNNKSFDIEIISLIENVFNDLTGSYFKFEKIEKVGDDQFEIYVNTENGISVPIQKISQGTLSILVIFSLIYYFLQSKNPNTGKILGEPGIVFIDEIDAHLHPDWQQKIVSLLKKYFPNVQFFLTAQNPLIIAGCLDKEAAVLRKSEDGGFHIYQFNHDFIGWESSELYKTVFQIEELDDNYIHYSNLLPFKNEIEKEINELRGKEKLNETEILKLEKLYDDLYYLKKFMKKQSEKLSNENLLIENSRLKFEIKSLRSEINNHKDD